MKLELLVLKWAVMEKFHDYMLGTKFHVYMDNSPLAYIKESKLGASQIQWLSKMALFEFTIPLLTGRSNKAANALRRHPNTEQEIKIERGSDYNEVEVILYSSICKVVDEYLNTTKVPDDLKKEALSISFTVQSIVDVTPEGMVEEQERDPILGLVSPYVTAG